MAALPSHAYTAATAPTTSGAEAETCSICFDVLGDNVWQMLCGHVYCGDCLQQWRQEKIGKRCPQCAALVAGYPRNRHCGQCGAAVRPMPFF